MRGKGSSSRRRRLWRGWRKKTANAPTSVQIILHSSSRRRLPFRQRERLRRKGPAAPARRMSATTDQKRANALIPRLTILEPTDLQHHADARPRRPAIRNDCAQQTLRNREQHLCGDRARGRQRYLAGAGAGGVFRDEREGHGAGTPAAFHDAFVFAARGKVGDQDAQPGAGGVERGR